MVSIALIGSSSYLSHEYQRQFGQAQNLDIIATRDIEGANLTSYDIVVNFALNPDSKNKPYCLQTDFDAAVARLLVDGRAQFIMLSSRAVYDHDVAYGARESDQARGTNQYGANRVETERRVTQLLGDRCTILRIANVIGYEAGRNRHSFTAMMLDSLRETGEIRFDISPFTRRDFIPVPVFCQILNYFIKQHLAGIYNVGSGLGLEVGRLPLWIIEGYGRGSVHFTSGEQQDEFRLDIGKLEQNYGDVCSVNEIEQFCKLIGRQLGNG
jgi:dTDP-4-dehydrorhamnose reductase/UDP-glucose 4-epimerase